MIADAKVPLLWLRNKELRPQPYVQTLIHSICKLFEPDEMYYIRSKDNPADLGTKFEKFHNTYQMLGDDSLFRKGPECLRMGIEKAVKSNKLVPINKISPTQLEKDMAALEIIKLHQLVITENQEENLVKNIEASYALDEESIDDAIACLIATTDETVEEESWLNNKTSGYRAQKATLTVREKVKKVEEFSHYLISPLRKRHDVFFRSTMVAFKAIQCWLRLKLTGKAPRSSAEKRKKIDDRITKLARGPEREASIEEIPENEEENSKNEDNIPTIRSLE